MPLISSSIPNLVNGVSQQPASLRLSSQAEEQINGYSSVVEGLRKRPGTAHLARLLTNTGANVYVHTINRDRNEQYIVMVFNQNIRVFDLQGNEKTVNFPNGKAYLSSADPKTSFRCVTVADFTFILNTSKVVQAGTAKSPSRSPEALVWVKQGTYGGKYEVVVDGSVKASYTVPDGSATSHATNVTTDYIAGHLYDDLVASIGATFNLQRLGSTIWMSRKDGGDFSLRVDDSVGDTGMGAIKDKVQDFSDLPVRAVNGFAVEISGDAASTFDNYYVKYESSGPDGVWIETVQQGETLGLNNSTMPHALIREANGTFTFKPIDWANREVGDLDSNPLPSFVGRSLNDMFFHRNRLGFVADENIVMSKASDFFNLFRGTATALLDDDPIDVGVSHVKVSILRHAIPFNENLLLFSDQTQFQLGDSQLLTPETVSINQTTEYECSLRAKPVGVGSNVYFAVNRGNYTGIREYFVDSDTESEQAYEVTVHVPKYLKGDVYKLAASSNEDLLLALSEQAPNEIYVYKFYFAETEKMQASWSRWVFPPDHKILNCDFIESRLYLVIEKPDGVHLESMDLEPGAVQQGWDIPLHLDSRVTDTQVILTERTDIPSGSGEPVYDIALPFSLQSTEDVRFICAGGGSFAEGEELKNYSLVNTGATSVLRLEANLQGQPFVIGRAFDFRYRLSPFMLRENSSNGGQQALTGGRLQIRKASIQYDKTGYFRVEVTPQGRATYTYPFTARSLGAIGNILGKISIEDGRFDFPVQSKNDQAVIEIVNDSYLPCFLMSIEWEGYYHLRSRRY